MPKLILDPVERAAALSKMKHIGKAPQTLDDRYIELAYRLSQIHGSIRVTKEKRGIHFYMASPICLEQFGKAELHKMHLAVNAEKAVEKQSF